MRFFFHILIGCMFFLVSGFNAASQAPPKPRDSTILGPQTFAMVMGISSYLHVHPLKYADKDAEMFRDYLKSPAGGKLPDDNIYMLLNEQALLANFFTKGFKWLQAKQLQKGDRLFIYLAGHGDAIDEDQFFYLAYDCNPAGDKNNYLVSGAIRMADVKIKIQREAAKGVDVYLIMDACRSGELPGGQEGKSFFNQAISEKKAGEIMMLASSAGQESLEDGSIGNGHGLFTYYLVDGLNGMADSSGTSDNNITLEEIQKYVYKNVPVIAQQRFKRKQEPFFCCPENIGKIVGIVDTAYLTKWKGYKMMLSKNPSPSVAPRGRGGIGTLSDTLLIEAYNYFNTAIKENRLIGKESAEYYYDLMAKKFPSNPYTIDAQTTLAAEFINFAQSKINLYLDCRDVSSIQKIRAQIDVDEQTAEINTSLDRMEAVARQEFYEVGNMLARAIEFIMPDDPEYAKSLMGKMYFFKTRGYFGKARKIVDINIAFKYAYIAYASDNNAAYILNTLASLHLDANRIDSSIYYAKKAIFAAPKWRYPYVTLAFAYKTLNRPDSALKYYHKSVEIDPSNADAYVDLGHYYFSLTKNDSAISNYQKALSIEPDNVYASNNIGWLYQDKKKYDSAITYFKQSIRSDPKFINAYNGLSKTFFLIKQYDSARIYYSKAFVNFKDKSIVNMYIGNFYMDLKEYDSAKVYFHLAVNLDPDYEGYYNDLGRACFALKQYDSANYYYRRALQVNPYSAFALINIGLVFKELKQPDSTINYLQQAVRLEPLNPTILYNLGVIYEQDKKYDSAKTYFRKALYIRPGYKSPHNNLIRIFKEFNQLDSVTNFLKSSSQVDLNSISFMNEMGVAFLDMKRYDSAGIYYLRAIQLDPFNTLLLNNMGRTKLGIKQYDSAKIYLQKAYLSDPDNSVIWINLSNVFRQLKQFDSSAYYYKKQLFLRAEINAQTYQAIGSFYDDWKLYDSAIIYYKKALELDSSYIIANNNIGSNYMRLEKYDSAIKYFRQAVKLDPNYLIASLNLGLLYHSLEQYDSAIVYIQNAIRLNPSNAKGYFNLACSYALSKQPEQAILYLRQAYEKGYTNYDALLDDSDLSGLKD